MFGAWDMGFIGVGYQFLVLKTVLLTSLFKIFWRHHYKLTLYIIYVSFANEASKHAYQLNQVGLSTMNLFGSLIMWCHHYVMRWLRNHFRLQLTLTSRLSSPLKQASSHLFLDRKRFSFGNFDSSSHKARIFTGIHSALLLS